MKCKVRRMFEQFIVFFDYAYQAHDSGIRLYAEALQQPSTRTARLLRKRDGIRLPEDAFASKGYDASAA